MAVSSLTQVAPQDIMARLADAETFVLNIVAQWCPDCTERQSLYIDDFAKKLSEDGLPVYQVNVQVERKVFLSDEHATLTDLCGGHGYPRTVLIQNGVVTDKDNVEVITEDDLSDLAQRFVTNLKK